VRLIAYHLVIAAATCALVVPTLGRGLMLYDLGEVLFLVEAIRSGGVPGVDYAVNAYGPGRYLLLAALFEMFGQSLTVVWGLLLVVRLAVNALAFEFARRLVGGPWAWLPVACLLLAPGPLHKGFFLLGTLVLGLAMTSYLRCPDRQRAVTYGVALAAVALFRFDLGAAGVLLAALVCAAVPSRRAHLLPALGPLFAGVAATVGWLALQGSLGAVLEQVGLQVQVTQGMRWPGFPGPSQLLALDALSPWLLCLPLLLYPPLVWLLVHSPGRRREIGLLLVLGVLTCSQLRSKPEFGHLLQVGPMLWTAAAMLAAKLTEAGGLRRWAVVLAGLSLPLVLVVATVTEHRGSVYAGGFTIPEERTLPLDTRLGRVWVNQGEEAEIGGVLHWLRDEAPPGALWVPTYQPLYYALSGRPDVTGHVGVLFYSFDTERQQRVIARLEAAPPSAVVFQDNAVEGPKTRMQLAAPLVYEYLRANYELARRAGPYELLVRSSAAGAPR